MIQDKIRGYDVTVVGDFFATRGRVYSRIGAVNFQAQKEIEALFVKNDSTIENYALLSQSTDPIIRLLVAHNMEELNTLKLDPNQQVQTIANRLHSVGWA